MCALGSAGAGACKPKVTSAEAHTASAWETEDGDAWAAIAVDAGSDVGGDIGYQGPPVLTRSGRPIGFLRFVHMAPGAGRVRFVAESPPQYEPHHMEVVVSYGESSGYVPAINVPHRVRVYREGDDAGVGPELAESMISDVYNNAGCTVAFGGRVAWRPRARRQDPEVLRLVRVIDIPRRQAGQGMLRFMTGYSRVGPVDIVERGEAMYSALPYLQMTGMRRLEGGAHEITLVGENGAPVAPAIRFNLPAGEVHTLWIHGDRGAGAAPTESPRYLLTNDIPPERIGPDFTGEMPVYR